MEKTYRIKANVGKDQVLNVQLKRDVDLYEVLSLKLSQERIYKLHSSNYGIIVGRVLANDALGIPNAKVSVFIPISNQDKLRTDIKEEYPFSSVNSHDNKNRRYNILPDYKSRECHKPIGSFPSKRMVLDEDAKLEIYDKYYKYTTITNNSGDYMIFGVPVGEQIVHTDIDLSDIGILSQRPSDLIYKGYSINLFESPSEFKTSTNLNDLPQIISENATVNVYPFWGDSNTNEIAITRKDIRVQYKFEPTCVFLGSVVTDSPENNINHVCTPGTKMGDAGQLVSSEGTIEMIRKTIDGKIEQFNIKGNNLIDGSGIWCYQIPMNLDYISTDEYGNTVPTNNPSKGIPTRARVRFRITLNGSDNESLSSHRARYLVPNNPELYGKEYIPYVKDEYVNEDKNNNNYYEFGVLTKDECFRDLLWNKVYSVKSYIPRIQRGTGYSAEKSQEYLAIKGVNKKTASGINPFPFNKLNLNMSISPYYLIRQIWDGDDAIKNFWNFLNGNQIEYNIDSVREKIIEDSDGIGLDFYNDWINGCLYFPNWYWHLNPKQTQEKNEPKYEAQFCDCDKDNSDNEELSLSVLNNCSLAYKDEELNLDNTYNNLEKFNYTITKMTYGSRFFSGGVIKKTKDKDGAALYYYAFGQKRLPGDIENFDGVDYYPYVRLFSTDLILLGSISDCDLHGIPKASSNIPSTTANIPPIGVYKPSPEDYDESKKYDAKPSVNGMDWGHYWFHHGEYVDPDPTNYGGAYWARFSTGLFFGLTKYDFRDILKYTLENLFEWFFGGDRVEQIAPITDLKTCMNAERICELGVSNDTEIDYTVEIENTLASSKSKMDGLITRKEMQDPETRSLFATLNSGILNAEIKSDLDGYKTYSLYYTHQTNFDGRMQDIASAYTSSSYVFNAGPTSDIRSKDYLDFRFGTIINSHTTVEVCRQIGGSTISCNKIQVGTKTRHFYWKKKTNSTFAFPLYENSFYFYFGIEPGHTAIDEFYKNFLSTCNDVNEEPFSVKVSTRPAKYCGSDTNGKMKVTVNGASIPFSITVIDGNGNIKYERTGLTKNGQYEFSGLLNGSYDIKVLDFNEREITKNVRLKQDKIKLKYSIEAKEGESHSILKLNSYVLDGISKNINNLSDPSFINYSVTFAYGNNCTISIRLSDASQGYIENYYRGYNENEIYFLQPGDFLIKITEEGCTSNNSEYSFYIE